MKYKEEYYLANLAVEERKVYYKDNYFDDINRHLYHVRDIKIAPLEPGFDPRDQLSDDNGNVSHGANITISQLYQIVKKHDKNFFENPMAVGRAKREAEIEQKKEYEKAVMEIEEKSRKRMKLLTVRLKQGGTGSGVKLIKAGSNEVINFHKPHPSGILKQYILDQVIEKLRKDGLV